MMSLNYLLFCFDVFELVWFLGITSLRSLADTDNGLLPSDDRVLCWAEASQSVLIQLHNGFINSKRALLSKTGGKTIPLKTESELTENEPSLTGKKLHLEPLIQYNLISNSELYLKKVHVVVVKDPEPISFNTKYKNLLNSFKIIHSIYC